MPRQSRESSRVFLCLPCVAALGMLSLLGCAAAGSPYAYLEPLFNVYTGVTTGPTTSGDESSFFQTGGRTNVDPCAEPNARKFVRISLRNLDPDDYVHYFLLLVAFVNSETYPNGAVCPDDVDLYLAFYDEQIPEGVLRPFGNFCIEGPALIYFHENGQFERVGGAGTELASAIAPAQGTNPTYDNFFDSAGAMVPVPDLIIFHNPGTGGGAALKVSDNSPDPCAFLVGDIVGDPECEQDAFYYVDENDLMAGSVNLGAGSGRRVPNEIQGTGCECGAVGTYGTWWVFQAAQVLAPSGVTASSARCNEFLRGGMIEYIFVRDDVDPPYPQLLWRVTDQSGSEAHAFDPRADLP